MNWIAFDLHAGCAWRMDDGNIIDEVHGEAGALAAKNWKGPHILSGLAETPAVNVPCPVLPKSGSFPAIQQPTPSHVLPSAAPIAGFLAAHEDWDGVICLIMDKVYWVHVSANEIISFQASIVPDMVDHLTGPNPDPEAIEVGLEKGLDRPERLLQLIDAARQASDNETFVAGNILGLLVGADLKAARAYWLGQQIAVLGAGDIAQCYVKALRKQGAPVTHASASTLSGLAALYRKLKDT